MDRIITIVSIVATLSMLVALLLTISQRQSDRHLISLLEGEVDGLHKKIDQIGRRELLEKLALEERITQLLARHTERTNERNRARAELESTRALLRSTVDQLDAEREATLKLKQSNARLNDQNGFLWDQAAKLHAHQERELAEARGQDVPSTPAVDLTDPDQQSDWLQQELQKLDILNQDGA